MSTKLIIPNADFSDNALEISVAKGTPNATVLIASYGSYSITLNSNGYAEIPNQITPQSGVFGNSENQNRPDITSLKPLYWDMNGVIYISNLFSPFKNLVSLDLKHLKNTGSIQYMYRAFCDTSLEEVDLSYCDFSGVTSIQDAFGFGGAYNTKMKKVNFGNNAMHLTNASFAFCHLTVLEEIDAPQVDFTSISSENYSNMFTNCPLLTKVVAKDSANATFLIARLADAGYTFTADSNYVLTKVA